MITLCPSISSTGSTNNLARRDWPISHWIALANKMSCMGFKFQILAKTEIKSMFSSQDSLLTSPASIDELISVIKKSSLIVAQDSGPMHIANHFNIPCISLFGPTSPSIFTDVTDLVVTSGPLTCKPCHDGRRFLGRCRNNICMQNISPDFVFAIISPLCQDSCRVD